MTSSSDYSSSTSDEDSRIPLPKARANMDHDKKIINSMSLDELKAARDELLKKKKREEILDEYREKRRRIQRKTLEAEERLRSRPYGVASDSDAEEEEEELVWDLTEHKNGDVEEEFLDDSDSDSEKESGEDSLEDDDDNDDDESDASDDYHGS
ncbi:prothymosin alpha-like [Papaver somniferum]|uniref:prothymosin alpha-like n=1 Tax=Papaver somniferum TaxID=3469 RepID=UPI000E6FB3A5|nr:prothymosin alpha-like [Papaver somniferum]